jgi:serine/threonine/tyrosine protein kinase RAD53
VSTAKRAAHDSLGKGTFAEVYRAVDPETGNQRAIKVCAGEMSLTDSKLSNIGLRATPKHWHCFNERLPSVNSCNMQVRLRLRSRQEHICRLIEHYEDPQHICLVLEYVDGGDLLDYIMNWQSPIHAGLRRAGQDCADFSRGSCGRLDFADLLSHGVHCKC